jgi:hypothetical protein
MPILLTMSTLEEGIRYAEEPQRLMSLEEFHAEEPRRLMSLEEFHARSMKWFHAQKPRRVERMGENINPRDRINKELINLIGNPHVLSISELLDLLFGRPSGFLLGLVVLFIFQYLMGYVETGRWNTYSNGAWEFRATYVCIELRLGSYPFQKFRVTTRRFGVRPKNKNGVTPRYEPWVRFRRRKIYFEVQKTEDKAARILDVAKYWLRSEGRHPLNFAEEDYYYLNFVQEFHPQQSDKEPEENHKIRRLVLEHAQRFLKEVQQSEEVPIVYQPPDVEPAGFANGEHIDNPLQEFPPFDHDQVENLTQEFYRYVDADHQQRMDMTEEPQSVSANPEFAGI